MDKTDWQGTIGLLKDGGLEFARGLTDSEVEHVENKFNFRFPPDLRAFLQAALPIGERFPDWRSGNDDQLRERLNWPLHGLLFDVEHNAFWLAEWGPRPELLEDAFRIATSRVDAAPKLIPIYAHRFMPDRPQESGNPVFSVYQTDIIYYGFDLEDYLRHEFNLVPREARPERIRQIEFWDVDRFYEAGL
jgi:hypothetical protein